MSRLIWIYAVFKSLLLSPVAVIGVHSYNSWIIITIKSTTKNNNSNIYNNNNDNNNNNNNNNNSNNNNNGYDTNLQI